MNDDLSSYCRNCAACYKERHNEHCSVARCTECGDQFIGHSCVNGKPTMWMGDWPGKAECREFSWYTEPDSPWGVIEDLNRLYASGEAEWDRGLQRWVRR